MRLRGERICCVCAAITKTALTEKRSRTAQALPGDGGIVTSVARAAGRNPGDNDDTTRHLSGLSFRVLAFGLALLP
jgi:hypothetical protein